MIARDHKEHSCLLLVHQDVCNLRFQLVYICVLFDKHILCVQTPHLLPNLHNPFSFTGELAAFEDGEAVVEIEQEGQRSSLDCAHELGWGT